MMNNAIIVCFFFVGWLFWCYIMKDNLLKDGTNIMFWLSLIYILSIFAPLFYTLSAAVETMSLVDQECQSKLKMLQLNVELLSKQNSISPEEHEDYKNFNSEL